jgi:hypothetical protein
MKRNLTARFSALETDVLKRILMRAERAPNILVTSGHSFGETA